MMMVDQCCPREHLYDHGKKKCPPYELLIRSLELSESQTRRYESQMMEKMELVLEIGLVLESR